MEIEKLQVQIEADASKLEKSTQDAIKALKNLQKVYDSITKRLKMTSPTKQQKDWLGLAEAKSKLDALQRQIYGFKSLNKDVMKVDFSGVDASSINKAIKEALSNLDLSSMDFRDVIRDINIQPQDIAQPVVQAVQETDKLTDSANKTTESFKNIRDQVNEILKLNGVQNTDKNGFLSKESISTSLTSVEQLKTAYQQLSNYIKTIPDSLKTNRMMGGLNEVKQALLSALPTADRLKVQFGGMFDAFKATPVIKALAGIGSYANKALKPVLSLLDKMLSKITEVAKSWKSLGKNDSFVNSIKKAGLAMMGIGGLFGGIGKAARTWLSYNEEIQAKLNGMWYALGSLLAPAIKFIVSLFEKLLAVINSILRALGLAGLSMKGFAKATGSAAKEMKQLAGFDEINNLNTNENSGAGAGIGNLNLDDKIKMPDVSWLSDLLDKLLSWLPLFMQLMEKAAEAINNFTDWLLRSFEYIDQFGVSVKQKIATLAEGIADGFNHLVDLVNWTQLGQAIGAGLDLALQFVVSFMERFNFANLGQSLANAFNGLVEKIDFDNLGRLLVSKFNAMVHFVTGVIAKLNWKQLADKVAQGIKSALANIDIKQAFQNLSDLFKNIITFLSDVISQIDWSELGLKVADALNTIDWVGIITGAVDLIGKIAGALSDFFFTAFYNIDLVSIASALVQGLLDTIGLLFTEGLPILGNIGLSIVAGILEGIQGALAGIFAWLNRVLFEPIVNGVKKLFGIASPSKVMADIGVNLVDGLAEGLANLWDKISAPFIQVKENIVGVWNDIKSVASSAWNGIKDTIGSVVNTVKSGISNAWNNIKSTTVSVFTSIRSALGGAWDGIWNTIKGAINNIIGGVERMVNSCINGINQLTSGLRNFGNGILSAIGLGNLSFSALNTISLPRLATGTNYVPQDMVAMLHEGEAVVPKKYNPEIGGEETNALLRELIEVVSSKEFKAYVSQKDVGRAAVSYMQGQSRILGEAVY